MQKYRADYSETQKDGAILWYAKWMGGPTLSRINNCRIETLAGDNRATVYITGEADTFFSIPAVCRFNKVRLRGFVTSDENGMHFRHTTPTKLHHSTVTGPAFFASALVNDDHSGLTEEDEKRLRQFVEYIRPAFVVSAIGEEFFGTVNMGPGPLYTGDLLTYITHQQIAD